MITATPTQAIDVLMRNGLCFEDAYSCVWKYFQRKRMARVSDDPESNLPTVFKPRAGRAVDDPKSSPAIIAAIKAGGLMTSKQISKATGFQLAFVQYKLLDLHRKGEIQRKENTSQKGRMFEYFIG